MVCIWVYNNYVVDGNVGSVSDILIAFFTGLISLATTLLLVIAVINLNEWKLAKEFDIRLDLVKKLSLFYLTRMRLRISEANISQTDENLKDLENRSNPFFEGRKATFEALFNKELKMEMSNNKNLSEALNKTEHEIYHLIANINLAREDDIFVFINECKGCLADYKNQLNERYKSISIDVLGSPRELASLAEPEVLRKYASKKTLKEFLQIERNKETK